MKKLGYIICIAGWVLLQTSCEKFLEEETLDEISVDYIYTTPEGLEVGVNALYNLMRHYNVPAYEGEALKANLFFLVGTDLGLTRTWHRPYGVNHTAQAFPANKWIEGYQIIDRANAIITGAKKVEMNPAEKDHLVAQARVIRGEVYLDLLRMYDNILLDTIPTTPQNYDDPVVYEPAAPEDVYRVIDADLDFAIRKLSYNEPYGRYNRATARHIRGKSAMWQADWKEAADQFDAIAEDGTFGLLADISQVFGQNLNHRETLFAYVRDQSLGNEDNLAGGGPTWLGSVFINRLYEMSSGEVIRDAALGGQSLGWSYPNDYLQSLYDKENDKRYITYYFPMEYRVNNPEKPNYGEPLTVYDDNFRRYHFSLRKYFDADKPENTENSYKDIIYYRFAETLLLGAEAHWRLSEENKALEYMNKIRERAFGDSDFNFTEFTLDTYLEESARELAFEKNRWFLLKRLGLLVERQGKYYRYGSNSTNVVPEPMAPHMVRLPVPQSQIDLMGTFSQNPGY
ncbi:RagB/SusD family nutrient uptake outer membrane protein [Sinomicrobium kalidii]|uniref:RagB/SusD family nutrient uptake outer membrane protein n=1 Tax=Sinomicrobium kalidii TaxID=2900738 RepID=UPI001E534F52|nr:RagB/SusD family nutrient uptake outer membrane protein [Sinomicrobium kalidii]UGU15865.1 RagB/SusD family nutrient uptake outer membrane protein [Sinomicrobium kalidii]